MLIWNCEVWNYGINNNAEVLQFILKLLSLHFRGGSPSCLINEEIKRQEELIT